MTADSAEAIRVLIVDDHPAFIEGLKAVLGPNPSIAIVGTAGDGQEAVSLALEHQPDVILMDLHMPGLNGIEATDRIHRASPHIATLVLTMLEDDGSVFAAMRAGACGYLLKGASRSEIIGAVEAVSRGEFIFGHGVAQHIRRYFREHAQQPGAPEDLFPQLTPREIEVLDLMAAGLANDTITAQLTVSPKTTRNHVSNIFTKLRVSHRAEAIVLAREAGLGRRPDRR